MTPEYVRVVEEAQPDWFLRENVPQAPPAEPNGYDVRSFLLDNCHLDSGDATGHEQMRKRRFLVRRAQEGSARSSAGTSTSLCSSCRMPRRQVAASLAATTHRDSAIDSSARPWQPTRGPCLSGTAGSGKVKVTADGGHDGIADALGSKEYRAQRAAPVTGRHEGADGAPGKDYSPPRRDLRRDAAACKASRPTCAPPSPRAGAPGTSSTSAARSRSP